MSGATSIGPYMGTLAIFLIFLGPAYAATGFDCNTKMRNLTTISFADLMLNDESLHKTKVFAAEHPNDFAYLFKNSPGYMAIVQEDKFHIIQCEPVIVQVRPQNECYDQLPIVPENQRLFLNPWTLIISTKANEIQCDAPILERYQLDGITYKVIPRPKSPLVPKRGKRSKIQLTWKYQEPADLMNSGIYNEEDMNRAWEYQRHPELLNPPPPRRYVYPDANGNVPGVTYFNRDPVPWYKNLEVEDVIVIVTVAIIVIIMLACTAKMVADRINHGSAFHSISKCRHRRQTRSNQADLTIRLNKPPDV